MSIEQIIPKFNKESFTKDFKSLVNEYVFNDRNLHEDYTQNIKVEIKKREIELMEQMLSTSIDALKLSDNKSEILDIIHENLFIEDRATSSSFLNSFLKRMILELLKIKSIK